MAKHYDKQFKLDAVHKDAEPLKHELSGFYSRRIDQKNRLVFKIIDDTVYILQCRTHYQK